MRKLPTEQNGLQQQPLTFRCTPEKKNEDTLITFSSIEAAQTQFQSSPFLQYYKYNIVYVATLILLIPENQSNAFMKSSRVLFQQNTYSLHMIVLDKIIYKHSIHRIIFVLLCGNCKLYTDLVPYPIVLTVKGWQKV